MENNLIKIIILGEDNEERIEKAIQIKNFLEDEDIKGIINITQDKAQLKEGEASAGVLEAILTIIFSSKAVELLARSLTNIFKKERNLEIEIEKGGNKVKITSENIQNIEEILPLIESIIKN